MKNLLLGIIAINLTFISADTNAFEFMGIKPGMTYKEVEKIASARKQQKWPLGLSADFHYTNERILWGMTLNKSKDYKQDINDGHKQAFQKFCGQYTEVINQYAGAHRCLLRNEELYLKSVEFYRFELSEVLNSK